MGNILSKWGIKIIKGSSNKQSVKAVQSMHKIFKHDHKAIIAITNDGPKGPRHEAKMRSLEIAKQYNAQIITITGDSNQKWIFNSWDKFYLPKPFSKIIIHIAPAYEHNGTKPLHEGVSDYMVKHEQIASYKI